MKHIKKFNEVSLIDTEPIVYPRKELLQFCKDHLINMIDTFGTRITVANRHNYYEVSIDTITKEPGIAWDDIKDDFIPFLHLLCKNYELIPFTGRRVVKMDHRDFTKEFILNDKVGRHPSAFITLMVKKPKSLNESLDSDLDDIIYYCDNILVELKDVGYNTKVKYSRDIDDSDIICITISSSVGTINSKEIIDYVKTISDFLSIDYEYNFSIYAAALEYEDLKSFEDSGVKSSRFIIYYEFKDN